MKFVSTIAEKGSAIMRVHRNFLVGRDANKVSWIDEFLRSFDKEVTVYAKDIEGAGEDLVKNIYLNSIL